MEAVAFPKRQTSTVTGGKIKMDNLRSGDRKLTEGFPDGFHSLREPEDRLLRMGNGMRVTGLLKMENI